ncbi:MAG: BMC domain-containing protein [Actinomycetota bacterium]|jgi:microcompartment protein CcmL/EutN|nr:BMC domain-containing protein [Actinomycetota bacterium]
MKDNIGNIAVMEFKSIARGVEVTDSLIKASQVNLLVATSLCPGKYLTLVEGEMDALDTSVEVAVNMGGKHLYSTEIIGGIDAKVIGAISGKISPAVLGAIGIVESMQMAYLINAADITVDTAEVEFMDFRLARGCGVNSFFVITGQLAAVQEAVRVASEYLAEKGALIGQKVIANPDPQVLRWLTSAMCRC